MSAISKFFQVTQQLLVEYKTDQYKIVNKSDQTESAVAYLYQALDGEQYCILKENLSFAKLPDEGQSTYFYPGKDFAIEGNLVNDSELLSNDEARVYGQLLSIDVPSPVNPDDSIEYMLQLLKMFDETTQVRTVNVIKDKIRIYLISGYVFNDLAGITLTVQGKVSAVKHANYTKHVQDYLTLLDYFLPKDRLKDNIHWLKIPLYLNSKFYDRYIEVSFPSPYDVALNSRNIDFIYADENAFWRGTVNESADILVNFATVSPNFYNNAYETGDAALFSTDLVQRFAIKMESNANYFNVNLYEDPVTRSIVYGPVYGEGADMKEFSIDIMAAIDSGAIPMFDYADEHQYQYDANRGIDDFIEMYGDETYRWVIINELSVCYNYQYHIDRDSQNPEFYTETEYYTNTIDYTGKTYDNGQFWKSKFIPFIKPKNNMACNSIIVKYTCHLFNRLNNADIIRIATLVISDPYRYTLATINTDNITTYKVVNKVQKADINVSVDNTDVNEKYIRQYYDTTTIVIRDMESGQMYTQGKMTLRLKHTNSNYMIRLYRMDDNNVRIPYDLTGSYKYKLVFPSTSGGNIEIYPSVDSQNYNLGVGALVFYITAEKVKQIMNVPRSERFFALTTDNDNKNEETSLYEGMVEYYI